MTDESLTAVGLGRTICLREAILYVGNMISRVSTISSFRLKEFVRPAPEPPSSFGRCNQMVDVIFIRTRSKITNDSNQGEFI